jgi:hypothetical protein
VLIVGRGEWKNVHPAVDAMRTGQAESYVFAPWVLRERWLYLPVTELLADWEASQRPAMEVVRIVGEEWEQRSHELRDLFSRMGIPFGFHPPGSSARCRGLHPHRAGRDCAGRVHWPLERPPMLLETSLPGVFAAGDVRRGSVKRVASAVGAGSIAVQLAHLRLAELRRD